VLLVAWDASKRSGNLDTSADALPPSSPHAWTLRTKAAMLRAGSRRGAFC
jgi:hypothetical protein